MISWFKNHEATPMNYWLLVKKPSRKIMDFVSWGDDIP